jgi:UDP-N-acetylmuramyl pentapeptide phosphotransferase/UDP-N-acetylglucosamine-1-phosphate transferase
MTTLGWFETGLTLLVIELIYLRTARRLRIIDLPNERSMHMDQAIIRGGGIVCWVAAMGVFAYAGFSKPWFYLGLALVAGISFLDDLRSVPSRIRLSIQSLSVTLLLFQNNLLTLESGIGLVALVLGVGMLNAYNFMDGVNGMTALYSLVTLGTLTYLNPEKSTNSHVLLLNVEIIALLVFAGFNVRRRAICFAGDVGSITVGFVVLQSTITATLDYKTYLPLLLLAVYGVDTMLTMIQRLYLRQNILLPHRMHLFQELVHKAGWSHLQVSGTYAFVQLTLNLLILITLEKEAPVQWLLAALIITGLSTVYGAVKWRLAHRTTQKRPLPVQEAALQ